MDQGKSRREAAEECPENRAGTCRSRESWGRVFVPVCSRSCARSCGRVVENAGTIAHAERLEGLAVMPGDITSLRAKFRKLRSRRNIMSTPFLPRVPRRVLGDMIPLCRVAEAVVTRWIALTCGYSVF